MQAPDAEVLINSADVVDDEISITLTGPDSLNGELDLELVRDDDSTHSVRTVQAGTGDRLETFDIDNLPVARYDRVRATWNVPGHDEGVVREYDYSMRVLGNYRHSQYNVPHEDSCGGARQNAYLFDNQCEYQAITLRANFIAQVNLNGSGVSTEHGAISREFFCLNHENAPEHAAGRSFREGGDATGACNNNNGALNNATVAACANHPHLGCGDDVYIHTRGVKTVTDYCPACCGNDQLDNFTTDGACAGINDLGDFTTIQLDP